MDVQSPWWRDAVIYQIYVRSFAAENGTGIGDIRGIRSRLGYLRELGVDAMWITPWYVSPMADGGYDVADYRAIDPRFGSLGDVEALIGEAHRHGLRVIADLVPNHTSHEHGWFREALAHGPGTPARDRYVFREGRAPGVPPNDWHSVFGGPAWTQLPDGEWYLHLFAPEQPDLNWENPQVRAEFTDILRFWLDRGVDGFRIDVAHGLVKAPGLPDVGTDREDIGEPPSRTDHPHWDRPEVHDIYREWRRVAEEYGPDRILVGEVWLARPERLARYVRPDELHTVFNFDFLRCSWQAESFRAVIDTSLDSLRAVGAPATWVLSNHDVTRHLTRYGRPHTRGTGPHREPREPADLELGTRRARAALLLMLALPGSVYVYQGEELGLEEVEDLPEEVLQDPIRHRSGHTGRGRDGCRVPLPWRGTEPPFGFSSGAGQPWLPQPAHWRERTVAAQEGRPDSMLTLYRDALDLRRRHAALGAGGLTWTDAPPGVLSFRREPGLLCAVNAGDRPWQLPVHERVLLSSGPIRSGLLPPDAGVWLAV